MQDIYIYERETTPVSRVYKVAAVLYSQSVLHVTLFSVINMLCTSTLALQALCARCSVRLFFVVPWFRAFPVCCSGIFLIICRWFQLPILLPV